MFEMVEAGMSEVGWVDEAKKSKYPRCLRTARGSGIEILLVVLLRSQDSCELLLELMISKEVQKWLLGQWRGRICLTEQDPNHNNLTVAAVSG